MNSEIGSSTNDNSPKAILSIDDEMFKKLEVNKHGTYDSK